MTPDQKIMWLLERGWLFSLPLKHEVFQLLESTYSEVSEVTRHKLLQEALQGPKISAEDEATKRESAYETLNLLHWLHEKAPDCSLTSRAFEDFRKAHPSLAPSAHPDLNCWISSASFGEIRSPITLEELLSKDPTDELQLLLTYEGDLFEGPNRRGLLGMVAEAISRDFEWGWKLETKLRDIRNWQTDLWAEIFRGLNRNSISEDQWREELEFLMWNAAFLQGFTNSISDFLEQGAKKQEGAIPVSCFVLAARVGDKVWDICTKEEYGEEEIRRDDWLGTAINEAGGKLVLFWLRILSRSISEGAMEGEAGLPSIYQTTFHKVLSDISHTAALGRVVLASQLHFLFSVDAKWTRGNVLPLLDWSAGIERAQQAWHGYLSWGLWNEGLLPVILPFYEQSFSKLSSELQDIRDRFCEHLANIAVYSTVNPIEDGWLTKFIATVELQDRKTWASHLKHQLHSFSGDIEKAIWDRWMDEYWARRIRGRPIRLDLEETEEMIEWATFLEPVFSQVVNRICSSPPPYLKNPFVYHELDEKCFSEKYPHQIVELLLHLLPAADSPSFHCEKLGAFVETLCRSDVEKIELVKICEELSRLGCSNANELKQLAERRA